jgi:hypothetical protein
MALGSAAEASMVIARRAKQPAAPEPSDEATVDAKDDVLQLDALGSEGVAQHQRTP